MSVGAIYHHFKDKEDVARALYIGLMEGLQGDFPPSPRAVEMCTTAAGE